MGRKLKRKTRRKAASRAPVRKTQSKRHNLKKKSKVRRKSKPRAKKILKRRKISAVGSSTRKHLDSRYAGLNVERLRKQTTFKPALKIPRGPNGIRLLKKILTPIAMRHFKIIGKSKGNYFYIRLLYTFKMNGKKVLSGFSVGITKIRNSDQFQRYLHDTIEAFLKSLIGYSRDGFASIRLEGIQVQGYK